MKLFHSHSSPFVRKVTVLLHEAGQAGAVEMETVAGSPLAPGSFPVALNPLGKIPALLTDDGQALYDSRVICRYLDDLFQTRLYPPAQDLWQTLTLEALADGILDASVLMRYEVVARPTEHQDAAWLEAQWSKVARALDSLEATGAAQLEGPLNIGHIGVGCALGYLDYRHSNRNWAEGRPKLAGWWRRLSARPSFAMTAPPTA